MEVTNQTLPAFNQSVSKGIIQPFFQQGEGKGPGNVRLYLKQDIEAYAAHLKTKKLHTAKKNASYNYIDFSTSNACSFAYSNVFSKICDVFSIIFFENLLTPVNSSIESSTL